MTEKEILKGNKLIAEFMNYQQDKKNLQIFHLKGIEKSIGGKVFYHSSWDWLMMVADKIENLDYNIGIEKITHYCENRIKKEHYCTIMGKDIYILEHDKNKLNAIYKSIIKFIKWYNKKE